VRSASGAGRSSSRAKAPAFWEGTVYLGDTRWEVLDLSVGTDKIFEKAEGYR
jgi:hypothetical protein